MPQKILIVGGVAGGASAAARLRRIAEDAEIILFEKGGYISFANCGLPYYIGGSIRERANLLVQTPEAMRKRFRVDVRTDSEVIRIDRENKLVEVAHQGERYTETYDTLILSPGATPLRPPIPGMDAANVFTVWTIPDADAITKHLASHGDVKSAVVIGGGFVGVEMAENLAELGIKVTIVEMLPQVMNNIDFDMAQYLHKELNKNKVSLRLGRQVTEIKTEASTSHVILADGEAIPADLVILSAGVRPNSAIAKEAGLAVGPRGHILVDNYLMTEDPAIYAVGDAIEVVDFITKAKTAVPLAGPANKQGRIAADNIMGSHIPYLGTQGTCVAKVFRKTVASTGISEKGLLAEGKELHKDYEVLYGHSNNHAGYYPGSTPLHMKVLYEKSSGRILGAQAVGADGTEKRIDVLATCIRYNGKMSDLTALELAYAPPYNTAKDPVNFLGYMAENLENDLVDVVLWREVPSLDEEKYQIVDVRTAEEFQQGTYPGSILAPLDELREALDKLDQNKTAVVFCRAGLRSYLAARILSQRGRQVKSITGGWLTYEADTYTAK